MLVQVTETWPPDTPITNAFTRLIDSAITLTSSVALTVELLPVHAWVFGAAVAVDDAALNPTAPTPVAMASASDRVSDSATTLTLPPSDWVPA